MAESKMLELLQLLTQRRYGATKAEIAEALGRSQRQIARYLRGLRDVGFPIVSEGSPTDGEAHRWRLDRSYFKGLPHEIPPLGLSFAEQFAVTAALELARLPHCEWIDAARRSAIEKLCVYLPGSEGRRMPLFRAGVVAVGPDEARVERIYQSVVETITDAAARQRVVSLTYPWRGAAPRAKDIEPLGVGLIYGGLYALAHIRPHSEPRWLNLARATRARVLDDEFLPPPGFDPRAYMRADFGIWGDATVRDVRVRFAPEAAPAIRAREIHPTQHLTPHPDGSLILHLRISGRTEFLWWLLGWGASAELLSPEDWREAMQEEVEKMREVYQPKTTT